MAPPPLIELSRRRFLKAGTAGVLGAAGAATMSGEPTVPLEVRIEQLFANADVAPPLAERAQLFINNLALRDRVREQFVRIGNLPKKLFVGADPGIDEEGEDCSGLYCAFELEEPFNWEKGNN